MPFSFDFRDLSGWEKGGKVSISCVLWGGLAEWSNAPHSKCGFRESGSQVQILHPPPIFKIKIKIKALWLKVEILRDEFARKADIPCAALTKIETGAIKRPAVFCYGKAGKNP